MRETNISLIILFISDSVKLSSKISINFMIIDFDLVNNLESLIKVRNFKFCKYLR